MFKLARRSKPSIIFIDEVDSLAGSRTDTDQDGSTRIKTELFVQMQGAHNSGVFVMAATNLPQNLDEAFLRRFDKLLYIPLPGPEARLQLFQRFFEKYPNISEDALIKATDISDGLTGSDIEVISRKTRMQAISKLQETTHFKLIKRNGRVMYQPCSPNTSGSIQISFDDLPEKSLYFKIQPTEDDLIRCVREARPTTDKSKLRKLETFAEEHGEGFRQVMPVYKKTRKSKSTQIVEFLLNFF